MKTSELKKIVEDNKFIFVNNDCNRSIFIYKNSEEQMNCRQCVFISKENVWFGIDDYVPKNVAQAILDYAYTPLEEREEEKKYYLRFPSGFNQIINYLGLSMRGYDCVGFDSSELYKKQFTQKEIDAMPQSWKDFFIKEEVK